MKKIISVIFCTIFIFCNSISGYSYSHSDSKMRNIPDEIVEIARLQKGHYGDGVNEFNRWYYGQDIVAAWCAVFVSWCADQVGAMGTAVPKRATCFSMKLWFERRNEYYSVESDYIPQKGDIVFMNNKPDGTDNINHVEIVSEDGFIYINGEKSVSCIGGNTTDTNYSGSGYVSEKIRPVNGSHAKIIGYAKPSYQKSLGLAGKAYTFTDNIKPNYIKYIESKMIQLIFYIENLSITIINNINILDNTAKVDCKNELQSTFYFNRDMSPVCL